MFPRTILSLLKKQKENRKISILLGARQVGKTTMLRNLYDEFCRKNNNQGIFLDIDVFTEFEKVATLENALNTFRLAGYKERSGKTFYVFLDEFQRYTDISIILKNLYDHYSDIKVYASGSSSLTIKNAIQESLAGRKIITHLYPLSFEEFLIFKQDENAIKMLRNIHKLKGDRLHTIAKPLFDHFQEFMVTGGYPEVVLQKSVEEKREVLRSIFDLYMKKEIVEYLKIERIISVKRLIEYLAIHNGQKIRYDTLAQISGLSQKTVGSYVEILKETFLIVELRPFFTNKKKELVKIPKIYFLDNGVANFFINNFNPVRLRKDAGALFEGAVIGELVKTGTEPERLHFWQDKNKNEVDIVIEKTEQPVAMELKFKTSLKNHDFLGLRHFESAYPGAEYSLVNPACAGKRDGIEVVLPYELKIEQK